MLTKIQSEKRAVRQAALVARGVAHGQGHQQAINDRLIEHLGHLPSPHIISFYMPIKTEASPLYAMTRLHGLEHQISVPVILGANLPLKFSKWTPDGAMVKGAFGAMVPAEEEVLVPDIVITPMVAFDRAGYRLGYGGGYYDRSLEEIAAIKPVRAIGFAYSGQEIPHLPREKTDYRLDALVTEKGVLTFG